MGRARRGLRERRSAGAAVLVAAALIGAAGPGAPGAEAQEAVRGPTLNGAATILPLQAASPAPSGAWPGGAPTLQATVDAFDAEVDFALSEKRATQTWIGPGQVVKAAGRNPLLKVDPERLAYRGLVTMKDKELKEILYEPLAGQLRSLSALLGTRLVVLPLRLEYRMPEGAEGGAADVRDAAGSSGAAGAAAEAAGRAGERAAGDSASQDPRGRLAVQLAVVDTRAGQPVWRGWVAGPPSEPDAPGAMAELASRVVEWFAP